MTLGGPAERVLATIEMAQEGRFEEVRDLFVEQLRPMVSVEALRAAWDAEMTQLGTICSPGTASVALSPPGWQPQTRPSKG